MIRRTLVNKKLFGGAWTLAFTDIKAKSELQKNIKKIWESKSLSNDKKIDLIEDLSKKHDEYQSKYMYSQYKLFQESLNK
jgi:hypothetical protein